MARFDAIPAGSHHQLQLQEYCGKYLSLIVCGEYEGSDFGIVLRLGQQGFLARRW